MKVKHIISYKLLFNFQRGDVLIPQKIYYMRRIFMPNVFFQAEENAWKSFENYAQSRGLTDTEALNYLLKLCVTKDLLPENFLINNRSLKFSRTWFIHTIQETFSKYNYNCQAFNIGRVTLLKTTDFLILPRFKKFGKESLVIQVPEETISTLFNSAEKEGLKPIVAILVILQDNQLELFYIDPRSVTVCLPRRSSSPSVYLSPTNRLVIRVRNHAEIEAVLKMPTDFPCEIRQTIQQHCFDFQKKSDSYKI